MNFVGNWERWVPLEGLSKNYEIESLKDHLSSFELILSDSDMYKVKVFFPKSIIAYASYDETYRYKTILELDETYGSDFYGNWSFFKITNSDYASKLIKSYGASVSSNLIHFCFITEYLLDIFSLYEPSVEFIDK